MFQKMKLPQRRAYTFGEHCQTRIKKVSGPGGCSLKAPWQVQGGALVAPAGAKYPSRLT